MKLSVLLIVAAFAGALGQRSASAQMIVEVGIPVGSTPGALIIEDLDGNPVDLSQYRGRPLLVEFWATWCTNCQALQPQMESAYENYHTRIEFLAIAVGVGQSQRSVKRHLVRHPSAYPYLFDRRGTAVRTFLAPTTSFIVVMDENGVVTYTGVGPDQDIEAAVNTALD